MTPITRALATTIVLIAVPVGIAWRCASGGPGSSQVVLAMAYLLVGPTAFVAALLFVGFAASGGSPLRPVSSPRCLAAECFGSCGAPNCKKQGQCCPDAKPNG
jgi:hypothetical protein